ncbi:MAG: sigma-70 family RNA polymerase sigma factor [Saprospiraceae bacterium]|nr:sigma-70 family RNA polymerase sigma factor [Saprospiraceae bacterium]
MDDSKMLSLIERRNEEGLMALYDRYSNPLFGIIIRIIGDQQTSEEILQQTFLKAWDKIETYKSQYGSLFTWLCTIAKHNAIDKKRLKSFERSKEVDSFDLKLHEVSQTQDHSARIDVSALLDMLDDKHKVILNRMYMMGMSQSDISKELEIPLGTVKTRARNAVNVLREILKDEKDLFLGFIILIYLIYKLWL